MRFALPKPKPLAPAIRVPHVGALSGDAPGVDALKRAFVPRHLLPKLGLLLEKGRIGNVGGSSFRKP